MNEIIVNHIKVVNLKPTKKNFINKNKKFSATGYYKNTKVKIYEVFDQNQGNLRAFVSKNKNLSSYFPKLIAYDERFIVEEWLKGNTLMETRPTFFKKIKYSFILKRIIKLMWSISYDKEIFDYIDYIYNRVGKTCNFDLSKIPIKINHNDLSLDNILVTSEGLKIIDNEFLGCNTGWILNIKNSFLKENFTYQDYISEEMLMMLWNIRQEWSSFNHSNT